MLITHSKYDDLSAYFLLQLYSGQFPSELQSPVNMLFRMEIPLGKENVGSTHKAMGTPSRLFAKWQLMEVPWYFLFSSVDFFSRLFMEAGFFFFLMQRRLDDIVKRCWKESSVQLRSFCDLYWSTTTCQDFWKVYVRWNTPSCNNFVI